VSVITLTDMRTKIIVVLALLASLFFLPVVFAAPPDPVLTADAGVQTGIGTSPIDTDWLKAAYEGITTGNWYLVAGAVLSLLTWALSGYAAKLLPWFGTDPGKVTLVAILSAIGGLAHALLAGVEPSLDVLMGIVKVLASAIFSHALVKKWLLAGGPVGGIGTSP
jgi:hypothetical protein